MVKTGRIALCFSGHLRDFHKCYNSLHNNFIDPLVEAGFEIDTFAHFWNVLGHRNENWVGEPDFNYFIEKLKPAAIKLEPFKRDKFIQEYMTDQWRTRPHISCITTSGDAASMWYGVHECFKLVEKYQSENRFQYDIVCRVRSDLLYDTKLDIKEITEIMSKEVIYIPKWHGKYYEVCRGIADYFAMGNYNVMKLYMTTFTNIDKYKNSKECIHTGEGFLLAQISGTPVARTSINFSIQRANGRIENIMK